MPQAFPFRANMAMQHRRFTKVNEGFVCENCGRRIEPTAGDTYRNHCPFCLHSKHVDVNPGDRLNVCCGLQTPVGAEKGKKDTFVLLFKCAKCGLVTRNKMALETGIQPDNFDLAMQIIKRQFY